LALGYILFGWLTENVNPRRLLSITAALEGGIALWALGFSSILTVLINGTVDMQEGMQAALFGLLLVLPSGILMGGILPLLSEFFAHRDGDWVSSHSKLYGANTLGGFLGVVLSTVVLLPIFGGHGAIQIASAGNIIAAIIFLALSNLCEFGDKKVRQIREPVVSVRGLLLPLATSFLVGFAALSLQVIFVRIFALSLGSTFYLLSLVLGVYFFWLALGGYLSVRRSGEVRISPEKCVLITCASLVVVGYLLQYATYANQLIRIQFSPEQSSLELYMMSLFGALSILLAVPVFCFGAFEPALVKTLSERCEHEGRLVGWCYGWSTIGALVGAMTTSFILLSHFELSELYRGVLVATAVGALLLTLWRRQIGLAVTASVLIFVSFFTPLFDTSRAGVGLVRFQHEAPFSYQGSAAFFDVATERGEVLFAADGGAVTSVAMDFPYSIPPSRTIFINGRANGNTVDDRTNMNLLGVLGAIFASPEARSVGVLGFGTGMTVGAVGRFSKFQQLTVFEFDENAPNYAPLFAEANGDIATDSRLSWKIGDALRLLQRDGEKYDVLVNRPLSPWMAGIERLYSEEFYQIVTASLAEDGVF
ncbi:MAG: hypothetical protein KDD70_18265, partial [Bdellovibrionales bacterium]|nr:hypothetical protein [Bdellovibrionales bacterium]